MSSKRNNGAGVGVRSLIVLFISTPLYAYIHPDETGMLSPIRAPLLGAALAGRFRRRADV
jgi:hypothetical protein